MKVGSIERDIKQMGLESLQETKEKKVGACNFCGKLGLPKGVDAEGFPYCEACEPKCKLKQFFASKKSWL